jgi:hypothetical protein
VLRNVDAAAEPNVIMAAHVIEQFDQATDPTWSADKEIMQTNRQQFRRTGVAFRMKHVESIAHIVEELIAR